MSEPLKATLFALQKRERGGVLLGAFVCFVLMSAVLLGGLLALMLPAFGFDFGNLGATAQTPPNPTTALWIVPVALVWTFAYCVLTASFEAACLRWMIRGERPGLFGMTLDEDTWRVYGIYWIWLLCYAVAWIGFFILNGLLSRLFSDNQIVIWVGWAIYGLLILVAAAALAPASAVSIAERRLVFGDAAQATEDHFGSLLGSYALLFGVQWLLNSGWPVVWMLWALRGDVAQYFESASDPMSAYTAYNSAMAGAMNSPGAMQVYWIISAATLVVSLVFMVLIYGVNARVARLALAEGRIGAAASP
ncbi:MAG: hypothetical protein IPG56_05450 [Caulobacteraceae bacterium]|nr:hypothetical protein [Caulobacteraceae bacterium]